MDIEESLQETLEMLLIKLGVEFSKIDIKEDEKDSYLMNIESENASLLIGYHGENIQALQHLLKTLVWKQCGKSDFNIFLDIDEYRKRQEEHVLELAKRKIDLVRTGGRPQKLPPMSPYFRRKVHMLVLSPGFDDIESISEGKGDTRYITFKLKS